MISSTLRRAAFVALASFAPFALSAQTETLTFDEVPVAATGLQNNFTALGNYSFYNFNVANTTFAGTTANAVSGSQFALGRFDFSGFYRESGTFTFKSAWLSFLQFDAGDAPDNTPVDITVVGYRLGDIDPTFSSTITLTNAAQQFDFNFTSVDEVSFETASLSTGGRNVALAFDNANVVPEPASLMLLVASALGLLVVSVSRKRSNI